jgi:hypothetical protein
MAVVFTICPKKARIAASTHWIRRSFDGGNFNDPATSAVVPQVQSYCEEAGPRLHGVRYCPDSSAR